MEELMQEVAKLRKEKAAKEMEEKRAKGKREGVTDKEVRKEWRAIDVKRNKARAQLNNTSYHAGYGVQDKNKPSIQSVSQSQAQSKRDIPAAKRSKIGEGRSDPAGTAQNNYSNLKGPQGRKSYGYQGSFFSSAANKPIGLANPMKGKMSNKPTEQGLGGFNKHHDRKVANVPRHPPHSESNRPPRTSTPNPLPTKGLSYGNQCQKKNGRVV